MKKRIEKMIPLAMDAIENHFTENDDLKPIPKTFQGSISSMGASVLQMGLLPTLAVFSNKESATKDDQRTRLLDIISEVLSNYDDYEDSSIFSNREDESICKLAAEMSDDQRKRLKPYLLDAAVAVKLSLRTFQLEES